MVLLENALTCQSRLILLDSFLVFFTGLTCLMWSEFLRFKNEPFSISWWKTLTFIGISLGLTVSVKWVGLFTITWIGILTILQLWDILTNPTIPIRVFVKHFFARAVTLIIVPVLIYLFWFKIHFAILNKMGPGSTFMGPEFQSSLAGSPIIQSFQDVAYGSTVVIRHDGTNGGYLHSHAHSYPAGSKQQQITCYPHIDKNSNFLVKYPLEFENASIPIEKPIVHFETVKVGSVIRLEHIATEKRLHSHNVRPGWNDDKEINEVSCYGAPDVLGDANDHWIIEVDGAKRGDPIHAMKTKFRLKHSLTGCFLFSRKSKLPEWAFGQQEVTCSSHGRDDLILWVIETANHPNSKPLLI
jgi:dolichyl-phosphate-mannose-protein mannosyltransferase